MSSRCQRSSVSGLTSSADQAGRDRMRLTACSSSTDRADSLGRPALRSLLEDWVTQARTAGRLGQRTGSAVRMSVAGDDGGAYAAGGVNRHAAGMRRPQLLRTTGS
jgi:hypothetical protein